MLEHTVRMLVPEFADYAFVHQEVGGSLAVTAARHRSPELSPFLERLLSGALSRMTAPGGVIVNVFETGDPFLSRVGRGPRRRRGPPRSALDLLGPRSLVAVPMRIAGTVGGVLTLARFETPRPFLPDDVPLVEALGRQLAMLVAAAVQEETHEEHIDALQDQLIVIRESLAGELAAARDGLAKARREREASEQAREQALDSLRAAEEARAAAEAALVETGAPTAGPPGVTTALLDAVGEAVIATDLDGRIDFWNKAAERLYGWTRDEALGRHLGEIAPAIASSEQAAEALERMLAGESWTGGVDARRKDGGTFPAEFMGGPIYGGDGDPVGLVVVSSARHEPTTISVKADVAVAAPASGEAAGSTAISVNVVVAALEPTLRQRLTETITLEIALNADPDGVNAERGWIETAIAFLVGRAHDSGTDVGRISIRSENVDLGVSDLGEGTGRLRPGPYVAVLVQDDGVGSDRGGRRLVFGDDGDGVPAEEDSELARVFALVRRAGGTMWVSSAPSQGTTVRMMFPLATDDSGPAEPASSAGAASSSHGRQWSTTDRGGLVPSPPPRGTPPREPDAAAERVAPPETGDRAPVVLLVEDEDSLRGLAHQVLSDEGYEVLEAQDGVEALRIWEDERSRIALVVTDIVMPRMSGRALIDRLRTQRPEVPALFMATYPDEAVALHGMSERRDPFIGKPFTSESLIAAVGELVDRLAPGPTA